MEERKKFAVLIDADNTSHANIEVILEEIAKYAIASVKRIYGDWGVESLKNWQDKLLPFAITPVQQFAYIKGKDATDMKLVIDAMDLLYAGELDGFCIVSSDSDFTPLVSRIRESGRLAYGFGKRNTASSFINACDKFIYIENLIETKQDKKEDQEEENETFDIDTATLNLIYKAIKDTADDNGWANLGIVGQHINNVRPDFDCRSYGSATLSKLLKKLPMFDLQIKNRSMLVRKFSFGKFAKYIENLLSSIDKGNKGIEISQLSKKIKSDSEYEKLTLEDIESKIKMINTKRLVLNKNSIKRVVNKQG